MSAAKTQSSKPPANQEKARELPRLIPVNELISVRAQDLQLKNADLAAALNYSSPNVIAMLKSGVMRLPLNKITAVAKALHIDPFYLALCVDAEANLGLSELLISLTNRTPITLNEEYMLAKLRKKAEGLDLDMEEHPKEWKIIQDAYERAAINALEVHNESTRHLKLSHARAAVGASDRKAK